MTDVIDSGEIRRPVGETRTRIDLGEKTQNLAGWDADLPPYRRPSATEDTAALLVDVPLGLTHPRDLAGPQNPPPPLPPQPPAPGKYDQAAAQPVFPYARVIDIEDTVVHSLLGSIAGVDGELAPLPPHDGWVSLPPEQPELYVGRHRDPRGRHAIPGEARWGRLVDAAKPQGEPQRWRVLVGVGAFVAFAAGVTVAVLVVFA
jgi:hypothetical protein